MDKKNLKKGAWAAGGIALLAAVSALCIKGMKMVDQHLKAKKEAEDFAEEGFGVEETVAETEAAEEITAEEAAEEEAVTEDVVAEEAAEEEETAE